jgi:ABC-type transport system involved in cytochrome c biogenesis permease subunit
MYTNFENFLANFSFLVLFISMLFYWIQASNFQSTPNLSRELSLVSNELAQMNETVVKNDNVLNSFLNNLTSLKTIATITTIIANLSLFLLLTFRWVESGHFPLSNLYESLMFLSWSLTAIHLIIEFGFIKFFNLFDKESLQNQSLSNTIKNPLITSKFIGSIIAPSALFTNAFATFSLPKEMQQAAPLVPALQSNWLMMHVTVMILSYAALILGSLLSIGFLIITGAASSPSGSKAAPSGSKAAPSASCCATEGMQANPKGLLALLRWGSEAAPSGSKAALPSVPSVFLRSNEGLLRWKQKGIEAEGVAPLFLRSNEGKKQDNFNFEKLLINNEPDINVSYSFRVNLAKTLDNLSYRILGLGFPLLTIGILSGAVWANEAWGSYWSWDPKETWALLTWLVFAIYLHTRLTKGWEGKKPALIASLGFVTVWICFLGVNLIGEGLHSYGWVSN